MPTIGQDITDPVKESLLAEAPCDDSENAAITLKPDKNLFFTCIGEDSESKSGTWNENSDLTELTLSLALTNQNFQLIVSEIESTTTTLSGTVKGFPLTKELLTSMLAPFQALLPQGLIIPEILQIDVDISFNIIE